MDKTIDARLKQMEANQVRIGGDIQTLYNRANDLAISNAKLETTLDNLLVAVGKLTGAVEGLKAKPGDKWEKFVYAVISALVVAAVAYFTGRA